MDVQAMREFVDLEECRSFTAVARKHYMSQPAVTKHVQALERELGTQLVLRTSREVEFTEAGLAAAESFRSMLAEYEGLVRKVDSIERTMRGELRIGVLYYGIADLTQPYVDAFLKEHQDVDVTYVSCQNYQVLDAMDERRIDVGVALNYNPRVGGYGFKPVRKLKPVVCVSEDSPLAALETVGLDDLRDYTVLLLANEGLDFEGIRRGLGCEAVRSAVQIDMVPMFLRTDPAAFSLTNDVLVGKLGPGLAYRPLHGYALGTHYGYVYRPDDARPAVRAFLGILPDIA